MSDPDATRGAWSMEHYGFPEADAEDTPGPPPAPVAAPADRPRRRPRLVAAAAAAVLVAGLGGVASAEVVGNDTGPTVAVQDGGTTSAVADPLRSPGGRIVDADGPTRRRTSRWSRQRTGRGWRSMTTRRDPHGRVLLAVATVLGIWLGLTAPSTSPVEPPAPVDPLTTVAQVTT